MALPGLKNKNKTQTKDPGSTNPSARSSNKTPFNYIMIPAAALVLVVMAAAWWVLNQTIGPVNERHQQILTEQVADQYEAYFNNVLSQHQALMNRLASSQDVIERLSEGDRSVLDDAEERIASQVPHGLAVRLFPQEEAETQPNTNPPLGFAGLDMIRRAEQGQALPWEAHQAEGQPYLHSVVAVRDSRDLLVGTLSISQSMEALKQALNGIDGDKGNVVVRQQFQSGPQQTLLTYGAKNSNEVLTLRSVNPNWTLTFQPSDDLAQSTVFTATGLWAVLGLIIVVGLKSLFFAAQRIQKALRHDGNAFTRDIGRWATGQAAESPTYTLAIFNSMAKSLNRQRVGRSAPRSTQPHAVPTTYTPATAAAAATEDEIDVNLIEGDSDILGMEAPAEKKSYGPPVTPTIFQAYDIRGVVGETLDAKVAHRVGLAIGSEAYDRGEQRVIVGRDGRLSSPELTKALITGLIESGRDVIDIGLVPTPLAYFAVQKLAANSCVMVTGSHNPSQYNGFKVMLAGNTLAGDEIRGLYDRIENDRLLNGTGELTQSNVVATYIDRIVEDVKVSRPMKVVIDCGNGVAGSVAPQLIKSLGCHVLPLYCDLDGHFPNHDPDPGNPENLQDLARTVVETRADIGLAFDGDGDRLGVVTNSGKIIQPDRLLMLLAKDVITRNPGTTVIYDVKCSRRLHGLIVGYGGKALMWKTGHSHTKRKIKETGALLAGEMSGHIFYKERWYGFDDALYAASRLLEIISAHGDSLDTIFASFPEDLSTPELSIPSSDEHKFRTIEQLQRDASFEGGKMNDIDGLRVDYSDGWGLVRASNTAPKLVCRFEADNDKALKRIQDAFRTQLLAVDSQLRIPF